MAGGQLLVQVAFRVVVFGEDQDAEIVPLRRSGLPMTAHVLANPVDELPDASVGQCRGPPFGDLRHFIEQFLLAGEQLLALRAIRRSAVDGSRRRFDLGVFLGLQLFFGEVARSSSLPTRLGQEIQQCRALELGDGAAEPSWLLPIAADSAAMDAQRAGEASIDDSSRCCSPVMSKPAAACLRLVSPLLKRCSRSWRYSSSRLESRSSGASAGRSSNVDLHHLPLGKAALDLRGCRP